MIILQAHFAKKQIGHKRDPVLSPFSGWLSCRCLNNPFRSAQDLSQREQFNLALEETSWKESTIIDGK